MCTGCLVAFTVFSKAGTCDTVPSVLEKVLMTVSPNASLSALIQRLNLAGFPFVTPVEASERL